MSISSENKSNQVNKAAIQSRRLRDMRTVSQMIALYCEKQHTDRSRHETAYCGEPLCEECAALDHYAMVRTENCVMIARGTKSSCDECEIHCYRPEQRERIRNIMRFSGPRMLTKHPVAAVRHLLGK